MSTASTTATTLADPWGARARDWAEVEDEGSRPLFERVLALAEVEEGSRLLDVGCGSGLACRIAADRGAAVAGLDASPGLLALAAELVPDGDFRRGDMVDLPWEDDSFDAVIFINTFFFTSNQQATLSEAVRVARPGGKVAVTTWSSPQQMQSAAYLAAVGPLLPEMPAVDPFIPLDSLTVLAGECGLGSLTVTDLDWLWHYPDLETALRGLLSVGLSTVAITNVGETAVRRALSGALRPFRRIDGSYRLDNRIHCVVGTA